MDRAELISQLSATAGEQAKSLIASNMVFAVDALADMVLHSPAEAHAKGVAVRLVVHLSKRDGPGYDVATELDGQRVAKWHDATDPEGVATDQPDLPGVMPAREG